MSEGEPSGLSVLEAADPNKPVQLCILGPATGGRFVSATKIAFWFGQQLGTADLASGTVTMTGELTDVPSAVSFSPDGSSFAYRVGGDTDGLSTHLVVAGKDRTLITRAGIGGHGGTRLGPLFQLAFSADGKYLLSVDSLFANFASGPPNFLVYGMDGSTVFESALAGFGVWSPIGAKLYFLMQDHTGVHSWDAAGDVPVAPIPANYYWPTMSPDGRTLIFTSFDAAGLPHLWRIDLGTKVVSQLSKAQSSLAVFVAADVIWSSEEQPCDCGMGGASAPDGNVLSRDLVNGREGVVDIHLATPGSDTRLVLDVLLN